MLILINVSQWVIGWEEILFFNSWVGKYLKRACEQTLAQWIFFTLIFVPPGHFKKHQWCQNVLNRTIKIMRYEKKSDVDNIKPIPWQYFKQTHTHTIRFRPNWLFYACSDRYIRGHRTVTEKCLFHRLFVFVCIEGTALNVIVQVWKCWWKWKALHSVHWRCLHRQRWGYLYCVCS